MCHGGYREARGDGGEEVGGEDQGCLALTVLYLALTVLYLALTVLHLALTVLYMALTVLYVA